MFKKIQAHFKKPKGIIGRLAGKKMAMENKTLNKWTLKQLKIRSEKKMLEVGFGPGYAMDSILKRYPSVHLDGVDVSRAMKEEATHRIKPDPGRENVQLLVGDIGQIALQRKHYDLVFSVNNYTLWDDKVAGLDNIYAAMASKGKVAITMQPRHEDENENKAERFAKEIQEGLKQVGFQRIKTRYKRIPPEMAVCVTAIKS